MINYVPSSSGVGVPTGTAAITAGLYSNKPPSTSYACGTNLANFGVGILSQIAGFIILKWV